MSERPELTRELTAEAFREYYYLKEELASFCRENGLPASGPKTELTARIAYFLDTGLILPAAKKPAKKKPSPEPELTLDSIIEENLVCSEKHRAFFKSVIGSSFSFNVAFQKWLKGNPGKTYRESVTAYRRILAEKKRGKSSIDCQFEYNTYIRDFFADNPGRTLDDAIRCWRFKKSLKGHNRYESSDLSALDAPG